MIKAGADLKATTKNGWTPLMVAVENGHKEITETLIKAGADLEATTKYGITALIRAAEKGRKEIAEVLIKAGADPSVLSAEYRKKYQHILCNTNQPYALVNDYTVSKYEGEVQGLGSLHKIFNFKAGTMRESTGQAFSPKEYFVDMRAQAERDEVMQAYDFMKAKGKGQDIPAPFFEKKSEPFPGMANAVPIKPSVRQ